VQPENPSQALRAVVSQDPEASFGPDEKDLTVEHKTFPIQPLPAVATQLSNWGHFEGAVLAVAFPRDGDSNVIGSAVLIAPGVALGAMHVFDHEKNDVIQGAVGAMCYGLDDGRADLWRIENVVGAAHGKSDLAVYALVLASEMPPDRTLTHAIISTRTPAVGERVTIIGFRSNETKGDAALVDMQLRGCTGTVVKINPLLRDASGMPYPCIELDCDTLGGMSGGPVFDSRGHLVGLLSRGMNGGPSWISMLWPVFGWSVPRTWPARLMRQPCTLLEMAPGLCAVDRREALDLDHANQRLTYRPWT
jgi:hypothetical protein